MEMAAFANTAMVRYLDCNDTYVSKGSGHPSDMIGACLAVADARHASGKETLLAIAAAYEIFTALADIVPLRDLGWDQGVFVVLGSASGAAKLLRLTSEQTANALAIAITSSSGHLRDAGAICLGKTALHEFAWGGPGAEESFPTARNPWYLDYAPGSSSSGSGAAVAARLCMGATGTDTGGSIRHPACVCSLVGMKPTRL